MSFFSSPLISLTEKGLYCEAGGFYIDPHRAVDLAVITHAHSDHARRGSKRYLCVESGLGLLKSRLEEKIVAEGFQYGEKITLGDVRISFHSAGHILGSAQIRVERAGEVWVASGDYKRDFDPSCDPFEPIECDTFITEATFGTPKYTWDKSVAHGKDLADWWEKNASRGKNCVLFGYSLGKAQRILAELYPYAKKPILIHSSIDALTQCYRNEGRLLAPTKSLLEDESPLEGEFILAPPSIMTQPWVSRLGTYETAFASGWMQGGNPFGRESRYDRGFVMSDHADWNDLNQTIKETRARRVFVQHRNGVLVRHLREKGIDAHPVETLTRENYVRLGGESPGLFV